MEAVLTTKTVSPFDPLTPMSDQDKISPCNINTISSRQVLRIKKKYQLQDYKLIQNQILKTEHHKNGMEDSKENY